MILKVTGDSLQKVESEFTKIIDSNVGRGEKLKQLFSLMAEGHVETQSIMKEGLYYWDFYKVYIGKRYIFIHVIAFIEGAL